MYWQMQQVGYIYQIFCRHLTQIDKECLHKHDFFFSTMQCTGCCCSNRAAFDIALLVLGVAAAVLPRIQAYAIQVQTMEAYNHGVHKYTHNYQASGWLGYKSTKFCTRVWLLLVPQCVNATLAATIQYSYKCVADKNYLLQTYWMLNRIRICCKLRISALPFLVQLLQQAHYIQFDVQILYVIINIWDFTRNVVVGGSGNFDHLGM